jgi:hypothetical protein
MKIKSFNRRSSYIFTQRIHCIGSDDVPELITQQLVRSEVELENVLRWEDDGGQIITGPNVFRHMGDKP